MKITVKEYKTSKIKLYLKKENMLFFFSGINRDSASWMQAEQTLKNINFQYYKLFNTAATNTLKTSIYTNIITLINGPTFFVKPIVDSKPLYKSVLLNNFEPLLFTLLAIKLNNKVYGVNQIKCCNSLEYKENLLLFYQFTLTHLKAGFKLTK